VTGSNTVKKGRAMKDRVSEEEREEGGMEGAERRLKKETSLIEWEPIRSMRA
jgi:hypothetical protein